jgi:hypothetical protein
MRITIYLNLITQVAVAQRTMMYVLEKLRPKGQFLFGEKNRMIRETRIVEFTN